MSQVFFKESFQSKFDRMLNTFFASFLCYAWAKEGNAMQMYNIELCGPSAGRPEPPVRLTINVMAENNQQAIECAKERLVSVGLKNNADMVRVRENGGSIIWEGR